MPLIECDVLTSKNVDAKIAKLNSELKILWDFKKEFPGSSAEWDLGVTLVRNSYLVDYIKSIAADQIITADQPIDAGQANLDSWPLKFIDWEKAVEDYKKKHKLVHFSGIIYWVVPE